MSAVHSLSEGRTAISPPRMIPREHGAYGQLAMPLATALVLGRPTFAALALTLASAVAFIAHEPLLVALGRRGHRATTTLGNVARRQFAGLTAIAVLSAGLGFALGGRATFYIAGIPAALALACAGLIAVGREKTTAGELVVATALSAASLPVALAAGLPLGSALAVWVLWSGSFGLAVLSIRGVVLRARRDGNPRTAWLAAAVGTASLAASLVLAHRGTPWRVAPWALAAPVLMAAALAVVAPSPRHLRRVGWISVTTSFAVMAALVLGLR